jgi:hypothetical protein
MSGVALAGSNVVSGKQTLQIKAGLRPARAGARHVTSTFRFDYRSTTPGQQAPYNTKSITPWSRRDWCSTLPPACKRSLINSAHGDLSACPRNTIVGHGTVVVNARPTVPTLISGTVTIYNAVNNIGQGQPKGTRNLVLWVTTSIGLKIAVPFRVLKGRVDGWSYAPPSRSRATRESRLGSGRFRPSRWWYPAPASGPTSRIWPSALVAGRFR